MHRLTGRQQEITSNDGITAVSLTNRDRGTYTAGTANATPVFELGRQLSYFAAPFL